MATQTEQVEVEISDIKIGQRIKGLREDNDWTQSTLGNKMGLQAPAISKIESGSQQITPTQLVQFSRIFNVRLEYLLGMSQESDRTKHEKKSFVRNLLSLFRVVPTENFNNSEILTPEDFMFSMEGDYLVLTAKEKYINFLKHLAIRRTSRPKLRKNEYKQFEKDAIELLFSNPAKGKKCNYFFVSKEQMEKILDEKDRCRRIENEVLEVVSGSANIEKYYK